MATRTRTLVAVGLVLTAAGAIGMAALPNPVTADATLNDLAVSNDNQTINGSVQDVRLGGTVQYDYTVPDAEARTIELRAGPTGGNLQSVAFAYEDRIDGNTSGTVELDGSILDHGSWAASDFDPDAAETATVDMVVEVRIEVTRANGETVTATEMRDVTVNIEDGTVVDASLGADMEVVVETTDD